MFGNVRGLAVVLGLAAAPAAAEEGHFYVVGGLGLTHTPMAFTASPPASDALVFGERRPGGSPAVRFAGGYAYGNNLRTELELGYRFDEAGTIASAWPGRGEDDPSSWRLMLNGLYDFDTGTSITPYVGLGLGGARIPASALGTTGDAAAEAGDTRFAYQAIAGVSVSITDRLNWVTDYRYFATTDPTLAAGAGSGTDPEYRDHTLMIGLRFSFGGGAAAAPADRGLAEAPLMTFTPRSAVAPLPTATAGEDGAAVAATGDGPAADPPDLPVPAPQGQP